MKKLALTIFCLTFVFQFRILYSQNKTGQWRWSNDRWDTQAGTGIISQYDKVEHFTLGVTSYESCLVIFKGNKLKAFAWAVNIQIAWEIKDALIPWERYGKSGGDGFSWKDAVAGIGGVFVAMLFNNIIDWVL